MPLKTRRSPPEKKRLSRAKDRRNDYGENDKAARKAIPLRKRQANRMARRAGRVVAGDEDDQAAARLKRALKRRWRKVPDAALGAHIAHQAAGRLARRAGKALRRTRMARWAAEQDDT